MTSEPPSSHDAYRRYRLLAALVIAFVVSSLTAQQLGYSWTRGQQLSDSADPYGEADVLRSAEGYVRMGFTSNYGLPDIGYGTQFETVGGKHDPELCSKPDRCVYLHNPPGNPLFVGLLAKIIGLGKIVQYRFVMVLLCAAGMLFFLLSAWRAVGAGAAAAAALVFYLAPTVAIHMHGLCYHGIVSAFVFTQYGLLLRAFSLRGRLRKGHALGIAGIACLQGFFGYESIFLCTFAAVPAWLVFRDPWSWANRRKLVTCVGIAGGVFAFVQVLHLLQVAAYLGSLRAMWDDLAASGAKRTNTGVLSSYPFGPTFAIWAAYTLDLLTRKEYLNGTFFGPFLTAIAALCYRGPFPIVLGKGGIVWNPGRTHPLAVLAAFAVSLMWISAMPQHASIHGHFVPRQFLLPLVTAAMLFGRGFLRNESDVQTAVASLPGSDLSAVASSHRTGTVRRVEPLDEAAGRQTTSS